MRAVVLDMDERTIAERHRLGLDTRDEMWKGELHVVPPPSLRHQSLETRLTAALLPVCDGLNLSTQAETGVFAVDNDYRVPDIVVFAAGATSVRGVEGPPVLVVEIRSPGDESYDKVPWYLERGAAAVLVVDSESLAMELFSGDGRVEAEPDGSLVLQVIGVRLAASESTLLVDGVPLRL